MGSPEQTHVLTSKPNPYPNTREPRSFWEEPFKHNLTQRSFCCCCANCASFSGELAPSSGRMRYCNSIHFTKHLTNINLLRVFWWKRQLVATRPAPAPYTHTKQTHKHPDIIKTAHCACALTSSNSDAFLISIRANDYDWLIGLLKVSNKIFIYHFSVVYFIINLTMHMIDMKCFSHKRGSYLVNA